MISARRVMPGQRSGEPVSTWGGPSGAGLSVGLSAVCEDLTRAGADVLVLEARDRPGGRVEGVQLPDGRTVQAGGEVFGSGHWAYRELVDELGMAVQDSYVTDPGEMSWGLNEGVYVGDELPWMDESERADAARVQREFARLAATVDPEDPWGHPDARRFDELSLGAWLRDQRALPAVRRRHELASLSLSCDAPERTSMLAALRKHATLGGEGFYDLEEWEGLRVVEGAAAVAERMAAELGSRVRLGAAVSSLEVSPGMVVVTLAGGEQIRAEAVVCTLPAGPLRTIKIDGLSGERLRSLRAQRHALAAKVVVAYAAPFWQLSGQSGLAETEWLFGSTWPQGDGVLLPCRPSFCGGSLAGAARGARTTVRDTIASFHGAARGPEAMLERAWGGFHTAWAASPGPWRPSCGPLHGTHEPPFYVAGSDRSPAGAEGAP